MALLDLEQGGLVRATGHSPSGPGRAAVVYRVAPESGHVVGVDIGRRSIRVAVADLDGSIVARHDEPNRCRSGSALIHTVGDAVGRAVASAGLAPAEVAATVVGTPGVPDARTGTVHRAPNLPGWERKGLLHSLAERLRAHGSDLVVENDANLCAVGEHALGAALRVDVLVYLTVGTGVGMGVLVGGKLFRGAHGAAGEIADLPAGARASGARAHRPGPMEDIASAHAIVARCRTLGLSARSAREVFLSAADGDPVALRVVEEEAAHLAHVVAAVTAVLDPGLIVLGGGIGSNAALLAAPMRRALAATTAFAPEIVAGQLGPEAVLASAVTTALGTARELAFERREPRRTAARA
ncbi:ROK family protein [Amycolatopsis carbonis]|uniref:ROK family protein n=1 Tax=Amycolatopsis carbonis TaxID=715471 RepID=A0A9Y2IDJ2_9PSEU|nr:ROK family protein [Amycolatopsis sp. 2-15]WIX77954.1 ROK family protein [Amycolatopsis sp. 2-15]